MEFDDSAGRRAAAQRAANQLFDEAVAGLNVPVGKALARSPGLAVLQSLLEAVEARVGRLLADHTSFYWLWIARRYLRPDHLARTTNFSTRAQIRRTFDCVYAKFGRRDTSDIGPSANGWWEPRGRPDPDVFWTALYLTEHLYYVASCYRRVSKGAHVSFASIGERRVYKCELPADLERLLITGDRRNEQFGHPLNLWGGFADADVRDGPVDWSQLPIAHANYTNQDRYYPGFLHTRRLHDTIAFWNHHDVRIRRVLRPSDFLELLAALTWSRWAPDTPGADKRFASHLTELIIKGYFVTDRETLEGDLKYVYLHGLKEERAGRDAESAEYSSERKIDVFLDACISGTSEATRIDLHTWKGMPLVWRHGDIDVIDWIGAETVLTNWVSDLRPTVAEGGGAESGRVFESELRRYVQSSLGQRVTTWPDRVSPASVRKRVTGGADVDLGVVHRDLLFLVQCFIQIRRFTDLASEEEDEQRLWKRAAEKLRKVDSTARKLATGAPSRDGDVLPTHIRHIVPIACCPSVIHIRSADAAYHLTPEIPRVCTPRELTLALSSDDTISEILRGPWMVNVSR